VAADLACLCGEGQDGPGVHHNAHVGVAHAGVGSTCSYWSDGEQVWKDEDVRL
jgi:hypothetical protein